MQRLLVQYRESYFDFMARLLAEEGIFFYFDHSEEGREVLVLADSNESLPLVRPDHQGVVPCEPNDNHAAGREVARSVHRERWVGPTDAIVRGFDWTKPALKVEDEEVDRGQWRGTKLQVYDHDTSIRQQKYDEAGGSYQSHTAVRQGRLQAQRLDLERDGTSVETTVVTAQAGHIFELQGADLHDGRYLIVDSSSQGSAQGRGGSYTNQLQVVPVDLPYRPARPQRVVMPGPETAIVVGPEGEEIHTDLHGRVKVQFHWDRRGHYDAESSAWIRVAHGWAGPGWGTIFTPRIGMEVVVSFLGGDPERPIITGCLYNGQNPTPYQLPEDKTKSTIKTNSSLGSDGYNELRFEDKKGEEEVFIHAEKDFNEVVENNHSTRVKNCQRNTVDVDQVEKIGRDATLTIERDRKKTIDGDETVTVKGKRQTRIGDDGGNEYLWVVNDRIIQVDGDLDELNVTAGRKETVVRDGRWDIRTKGRFRVVQNDKTHFELLDHAELDTPGRVQIKSGAGKAHIDAHDNGKLIITTEKNTEIKTQQDVRADADVKIILKAGMSIQMEADLDMMLKVGGSSIRLLPDKIEINSATVEINGSQLVDVKGGLVRLKP